MIVCDRCGKPVEYKSSFTVKIKKLVNVEPGIMSVSTVDPYIEYENHYDLCQECLDNVLNNLSEFITQGKFNAELNNG